MLFRSEDENEGEEEGNESSGEEATEGEDEEDDEDEDDILDEFEVRERENVSKAAAEAAAKKAEISLGKRVRLNTPFDVVSSATEDDEPLARKSKKN